MPTYYVQTFSYTNPKTNKTGTKTMYGDGTVHNHTRSTQFTPDAITWLVLNNHWPRDRIVSGDFRSGQGKPSEGKLLTWNSSTKRWT